MKQQIWIQNKKIPFIENELKIKIIDSNERQSLIEIEVTQDAFLNMFYAGVYYGLNEFKESIGTKKTA